jgi:hypothetical protein
MDTRSLIATAARSAGRRLCVAFGVAPDAWTKSEAEFSRKMTLFLIIVTVALTMVLVRKLIGCYP